MLVLSLKVHDEGHKGAKRGPADGWRREKISWRLSPFILYAVHFNKMQYNAMQYNALKYNAKQCNTMH